MTGCGLSELETLHPTGSFKAWRAQQLTSTKRSAASGVAMSAGTMQGVATMRAASASRRPS
jgi:hypothetical protein